MSQVVCIGEGLVVLRGDDRPELEHARVLTRAIGGAEVNVALGLASLGVPTAWASRVGDDPFGRLLTRTLDEGGFDTSGVSTDATRPTGLYFKDRVDGRSRMHYRRAGSAATTLDATFLEQLEVLDGCELVHTSGITPAVVDDADAFVDALLDARARHLFRLSVDLNWRPSLWEGRDPGALHRLLAHADVVLAGSDEATVVWGTSHPESVRAFLGDATLVLKDDAHVAIEVSSDGSSVSARALQVDVVEPIGAGDGFAAGYLAALLSGASPRERLRSGHLQAAGVLATSADHAPAAPADVRLAALAAGEDEWRRLHVSADGVVLPAEAS